jgi:hypothetical protein
MTSEYRPQGLHDLRISECEKPRVETTPYTLQLAFHFSTWANISMFSHAFFVIGGHTFSIVGGRLFISIIYSHMSLNNATSFQIYNISSSPICHFPRFRSRVNTCLSIPRLYHMISLTIPVCFRTKFTLSHLQSNTHEHAKPQRQHHKHFLTEVYSNVPNENRTQPA